MDPSISTMFTQLIYSGQSHFHKHQPSSSPGPVPSLPSSLASPLPEDTQCKVCQSPFYEEKMLLCDICNAGWHMDFLLPPHTTIPARMWKRPHAHAPSSQGPLRHLHLPSPILDPDSDYRLGKNQKKSEIKKPPNITFNKKKSPLSLRQLSMKTLLSCTTTCTAPTTPLTRSISRPESGLKRLKNEV